MSIKRILGGDKAFLYTRREEQERGSKREQARERASEDTGRERASEREQARESKRERASEREPARTQGEREEVKKTIRESIKNCKLYPYARYSKLELALKLTLRRRYLDEVMTRIKSPLVRYTQLQLDQNKRDFGIKWVRG